MLRLYSIYVDDDCHDITITGNTVSMASGSALFFHNNLRIKAIGNVFMGGLQSQIRLDTNYIGHASLGKYTPI